MLHLQVLSLHFKGEFYIYVISLAAGYDFMLHQIH